MSEKRSWVNIAIGGCITIPLINWIWPWAIPLSSMELWTPKGSVADWLGVGLPFFMWAAGVTFFRNLFRHIPRSERLTHDSVWETFSGLAKSAFAGFFEEIAFRWLIFLPAIAGMRLTNFLFFGFLGFGIPEWFHFKVLGPIVDFTTLGHMSGCIFHPDTWAIGAALLSSNAFFRDGHKYLGAFGIINSWFMGMVFFYLALNHGLPAAILVHFLYDVVVFMTANLVTTFRIDAST